ncbi:MAG: transglutaminase domain-containing protein [Candidatus Korarchaeota archaeon NZ13-K]|nr:MAG: transglutaminase domain-containing protein [Candidatus Korarchaeota archaeon NZ13-K]
MRRDILIHAALLLMLLGALANDAGAVGETKVLIVSNDDDFNSTKLLKSWLDERGFLYEVSSSPLPGFRFQIILGGPKARIVGQLARRYMPEGERILLMNHKGYWTFHVTTEGNKTLIFIAGNTRRETLKATEILLRSGVLDFILSQDSGLRISQEGSVEKRDFHWRFPPVSGKDYRLSIEIPEILADFYRVKPRMRVVEFKPGNDSPIFTWYLMVRTPHDDELLRRLAGELAEIASRDGIEGYDRVWFIASFVQHLKYSLANEYSPTGDHPSYPVETLIEGGGDCEDLSMLLVSLLRESGFNSMLLIMPTHAAVAVEMPPEWVRFPRVRVSIENVSGVRVALVDLADLRDKVIRGEVPLALELRLGNRSFFYLESTGFLRPGELPNLLLIAESIGWPYSEFPIFLVSDENAPVPLIYDYLFTSRKVDSGNLITLVVKVKNVGDRVAEGLRLESQIYAGSRVEVGGIDARLVRLGELAGVRVTESAQLASIDLGPVRPGEVLTYSFTFHTPSPTVGARVSLYLGRSEVDFLRIRPFNP